MNFNPVGWFEIYVEDMARARRFYENVFRTELQKLEAPDVEMWAFPMRTEIVTDKVRESKEFYVRLFNCEVLYEGEEDWSALLKLGESELGFMKPNLEFQAPIFRAPFQGKGMWITVDVADAQAEYRRICSLGVPVALELRDEPWGDRHFAVIDPNGISVGVAQRIGLAAT